MEMKKCRMTLLLTGIIALSIVLTVSSAFALGGGAGGEDHYQGPAIRGQIVFTRNNNCQSDYDGVLFSFTGTCGQDDIEISDSNYFECEFVFDDLYNNQAYLEENQIPFDAVSSDMPVDCLPNIKNSDPYGLKVIQIFSWTESNERIVTDVLMMWVVPK
jgi:hypothetical protein